MRRCGIILAALIFLAACSGPAALDTVDAGRTIAYEPGVPNFDMESVVRIEDDVPVVDILYSIPRSSLIFIQAENQDENRYAAEYEVVAQLLDRDSERSVVEEAKTVTLSEASYDSTVSHLPHTRRLTMTPPPGEYVADVALTDLKSGSTARRRQAVSIAPTGGEPFISRPHLEGSRERGSDFEPIVSLHMPSRMDSLRATVQLYNLTEDAELGVTMRLLRFDSDTSIASPPYWLIPTRGSLAYRGVNYERPDTVQVSSRPIRSAGESAVVVFSLPKLSSGIYHLAIAADEPAGSGTLRRTRTLSVKNPSFPSLTALDDLVEALAYIAFEDEIEEIQAADNPVEKKRRFDAFWGSLVSNRSLAANLIKLYYGRIEEANLFFTGYKEGWKTDRGMIYTIFGPPIYIDKRVELEIWHYSYGDRDPVHTFVFEKAGVNLDDPFETFILQRRPYYQREWSRAVDRWRDGEVL